MIKMKADIKAKWLEKLRSGNYSQTDGYLKVDNGDGTFGHCCLGVLCEVAVESGLGISSEDWDTAGAVAFDNEAELLPESVREWAGLQDIDPAVINSNGLSSSLASLNDGGHSFEDIANVIEDQL